MRTRTALAIVGITAAVAVGAAAVGVGDRHEGAATRQAPPAPPGDAHYGIQGPEPAHADAPTAARFALTAIFTWRPADDASPGAGLTRAQPWLFGDLAAAAQGPAATGVRPLAQWAAWQADRDVINASVAVEATTPPQDGECRVITTVTQTVQHTDAGTTVYRVMPVAAVMRQTPDGWRLAAYRLTS